jgi:hypothetical protein
MAQRICKQFRTESVKGEPLARLVKQLSMLCATVQPNAFPSDAISLFGNLPFVGLANLAHEISGSLTRSSAKVYSIFMQVACERDGFCQNASMFPLLHSADMTHLRL